MNAIGFLLFGLLIGALARMLAMPTGRGGWVVSMGVGAAGSLVCGALGGFTVALLGAFACVVAYHAFLARRRAAARLVAGPVHARRN